MVETLKSLEQDDLVPGFGAMGLSSTLGRSLSYEEAEPVLLKALEFGFTFWDTAVCHVRSTDILPRR
jgi:aryl-alcohol dehydrogenase-like predicted oxidoreductase